MGIGSRNTVTEHFNDYYGDSMGANSMVRKASKRHRKKAKHSKSTVGYQRRRRTHSKTMSRRKGKRPYPTWLKKYWFKKKKK